MRCAHGGRKITADLRNWLAVLGMLATVMVASTPTSAQQKPNVVFILADNVGYADLGPYGGGDLRGAPTSRIDQLARERLRSHPIPGRAGVHAFVGGSDNRAIATASP